LSNDIFIKLFGDWCQIYGGFLVIPQGKCKQPGYFAGECILGQTGFQINGEPLPVINTVTSLYLTGTVLGLLVSFLVDTGAGVSLINGKLWNNRMMLKVEAAECLVMMVTLLMYVVQPLSV